MLHKGTTAIITFSILIWLIGCQADQKKVAATGWPAQMASRRLMGITADYALYANNAESAEELKATMLK